MKYTPVVFAYLCLFCLGFLDNSRGPLYPTILKYFSISSNIGSFFFSSSALAAFFMAFMASKLIQRFSLYRPSQIGILFFSLAAFILSQLPPSNLGLVLLIVSSFLLGLGTGVHSVTLNLIINQNTPLSFRRRVFAGLHSMYGVASFIAPLLMATAFRQGLDWKSYFLIIGLVYLLFFIISFILFPENENLSDAKTQVYSKVETAIWPMAIMFSCYVCSEVVLSSRLVFYLTSVHGFTNTQAGGYLSWFFSLLLLGRLSFAFFPIPFKSLNLLKVSAVSSLVLLIIGILYKPFLLPVVGLSMSYFFPCAMDVVADYFKRDEIDQGFSKVMIAVGGALVLFHVAFGQVSSFLGVHTSIWIIPALLSVVLYILQGVLSPLAKHVKTANNEG